MDDEIFNALRRSGIRTIDVDEEFFLNESGWILSLYKDCRRVSQSVGAELVVLQNYSFNAAAFFKPKFIAINFGVLELSNKIAFVIADYYLNGNMPDLQFSDVENNKAYYNVLQNFNLIDKPVALFDNERFKTKFELISSVFVLFTIYHEAGHIYHRHGARSELNTHDIDGVNVNALLTEEDALSSQCREVICDIYAFNKLIDSQLMQVKEILSVDRASYVSYLSEYLFIISLYFYFLSPELASENYRRCSHPITEIRMKLLLVTFFNNESLEISKSEKEQVISTLQNSLRDVLWNIFGDVAHYHWLHLIPDNEVMAWLEMIRAQIPKWYLYGCSKKE